jgi:hypothetical protein
MPGVTVENLLTLPRVFVEPGPTADSEHRDRPVKSVTTAPKASRARASRSGAVGGVSRRMVADLRKLPPRGESDPCLL